MTLPGNRTGVSTKNLPKTLTSRLLRILTKTILRRVQLQDYAPLLHSLLKSVSIYALASCASPLVSLFLAPFLLVTFSAVLNVVLNIILIPQEGALGAALATLFAYMALALLVYITNQYLYPIPFEIGRFCIALFAGIGLYTASVFLSQAQ